MSELHLLAQAAGSFPVRQILTKRLKPDPKLFIGSGKVEEIQAIMLQEEAQIAIFNNALSPAQQRNLERSLDRHVIDRTSLILDILRNVQKVILVKYKWNLPTFAIDYLGWSELGVI